MPVNPIAFDQESPEWLTSLRWVAIFGISGTILAGWLLVGVDLPWLPLSLLLLGLAAWNFSLRWWENQRRAKSREYILIQIIVDLAVLTALLWLTGGLANPFSAFYIFHVMIAGLLLDRAGTISVSVLAVVFMSILLTAGPLVLDGREISLMDTPIWMARPISIMLMIGFTSAFILGYGARLNRWQTVAHQKDKMVALGRLVAGLAHELGTPLNSILLLARDLAQAAKSDEAKKDLEIIVDQAKRCGDIVQTLLGYTRSSGTGAALVEIHLPSWLASVVTEARANCSELAAKIEISIEPTLAPTHFLPELALRQSLRNVLQNSLQALKQKPDPRIWLHVELQAITHSLLIRLEDNGTGFSEESKLRAFEAFYTTKLPGEGDGLGLYISYHLLNQVGGEIRLVEPRMASGAAIELVIPLLGEEVNKQ